MNATGSLKDEILSAIGEIRGDVRGIKEYFGHFERTQQKQWEKYDLEAKERAKADAYLEKEINHAKGGLSTLKFMVPLMWAVAMAVTGYMGHEIISLHDASLTQAGAMENIKKAVVTPEGWAEVQQAALASQALIREMKGAQEEMQKDIELLKAKPAPKIPAPVNKTVIVPAPQPYHFEKLLPGATVEKSKPPPRR